MIVSTTAHAPRDLKRSIRPSETGPYWEPARTNVPLSAIERGGPVMTTAVDHRWAAVARVDDTGFLPFPGTARERLDLDRTALLTGGGV
jgi:hypothetical protein